MSETIFFAGAATIGLVAAAIALRQFLRARTDVRRTVSRGEQVARARRWVDEYARTALSFALTLIAWMGLWLATSGGVQGLWVIPLLAIVAVVCYPGARVTGRQYSRWFLGVEIPRTPESQEHKGVS